MVSLFPHPGVPRSGVPAPGPARRKPRPNPWAWALCALPGVLAMGENAYGQTNRVTDHNAVGWYVYVGDHAVGRKWRLHTEYQWRRNDFIRTWQQSLARVGLAWQVLEKAATGAGYTHLTTYPYGEHPAAGRGVPTQEHRLHEEVQWKADVGRLALTHRLRLEQRWLGQAGATDPRRVTAWVFQHRVRYYLQANVPLRGPVIDDREFYLTCFAELFVGFGRHVKNNVFNQNRLLGGVGYRVSKGCQLELGYLNQITQHAANDPATGKPVFEINHGFRLNVNYSLDFTR
ncbi:MAG TPA: DUF2490 domain-containing protein [Cytophagales bacterium]